MNYSTGTNSIINRGEPMNTGTGKHHPPVYGSERNVIGTGRDGPGKGERKFTLAVAAGVLLMGSAWGMLECLLGGVGASLGPVPISMGAVLAGVFGIGFMTLALRVFPVRGAILAMGIIAGALRYTAPIGSCIICSAIAIVAEAAVFEVVLNRPSSSLFPCSIRDPVSLGSLGSLGVIIGYSMFVVGYMTTQILTPVLTGGILTLADLAAVLPIAIGSGFFAAALGGIVMPAVVLAPQLNFDIRSVRTDRYYPVTMGASLLCWVVTLAAFHLGFM